MNEKINQLTILQYEKDVANYAMRVLGSKKEPSYKIEDNFELENAVRYITSRAVLYETVITAELLDLQEDQISYFVELDARFKTAYRIKEKILQKMQVDQMSMIEAINSICDALRYTIVIDDRLYKDKMEEYIRKIEDMGNQVIKFKNAWGNEYYQGLNVSFIDHDGFKFEVQFHTPNSYSIKEGKLRDVYNIIRDPDSSPDLIKKCNEIRRFDQKQVKVPEGMIGYHYEKGKKK